MSIGQGDELDIFGKVFEQAVFSEDGRLISRRSDQSDRKERLEAGFCVSLGSLREKSERT